ncbi:hypothetical protein [Aquabacterium humicola]|uniref:hypothetical protein n=1 Tax=Aquabacterium humicola TaxID=3237377 RepID=UPI002543615D|nr:hypothetical protein [Rubrivivax pictus]
MATDMSAGRGALKPILLGACLAGLASAALQACVGLTYYLSSLTTLPLLGLPLAILTAAGYWLLNRETSVTADSGLHARHTVELRLTGFALGALLMCLFHARCLNEIAIAQSVLHNRYLEFPLVAPGDPFFVAAWVGRLAAIANEPLLYMGLLAIAVSVLKPDREGPTPRSLPERRAAVRTKILGYVADPTRAIGVAALALILLAGVMLSARIDLSALAQISTALNGGSREVGLATLWQLILVKAALPIGGLLLIVACGYEPGRLGRRLTAIACAMSLVSVAAIGQGVSLKIADIENGELLRAVSTPADFRFGRFGIPFATMGFIALFALVIGSLRQRMPTGPNWTMPASILFLAVLVVTAYFSQPNTLGSITQFGASIDSYYNPKMPATGWNATRLKMLGLVLLHALTACGAIVIFSALVAGMLRWRGDAYATCGTAICLILSLGLLASIAAFASDVLVQSIRYIDNAVEGGMGSVRRSLNGLSESTGYLASWLRSGFLAALVIAIPWIRQSMRTGVTPVGLRPEARQRQWIKAGAATRFGAGWHTAATQGVLILQTVVTAVSWLAIVVVCYLVLFMDGWTVMGRPDASITAYAEYSLFGIPSPHLALWALLGPGLLLLPLTLPIGLAMGRRPSILLLRPFDRAKLAKATAGFVRSVLARRGPVYTLSDSAFYDRWYVRWPVVAPQIWALTYRLPRVHATPAVDRTIEGLQQWLLRNLNWLSSRSKIFTIAASTDAWQELVRRLALASNLIVVDISEGGPGLAWEVAFIRDEGLLARTVFVSTAESRRPAQEWLRSLRIESRVLSILDPDAARVIDGHLQAALARGSDPA